MFNQVAHWVPGKEENRQSWWASSVSYLYSVHESDLGFAAADSGKNLLVYPAVSCSVFGHVSAPEQGFLFYCGLIKESYDVAALSIHKSCSQGIFLILGNRATLIVITFMEAAIGVIIILGLLFCFLMWAQVIRFDSRKVRVEKVEDGLKDDDDN